MPKYVCTPASPRLELHFLYIVSSIAGLCGGHAAIPGCLRFAALGMDPCNYYLFPPWKMSYSASFRSTPLRGRKDRDATGIGVEEKANVNFVHENWKLLLIHYL